MTDKKLEQALRSALKPQDPGEDFSAQVMQRLNLQRRAGLPADDAGAVPRPRAAHTGRRAYLLRWAVPAALAACAMAAVGLQWRHDAVERERGVEARAQLLQALSIAGAQVNSARAAVLREEHWLD